MHARARLLLNVLAIVLSLWLIFGFWPVSLSWKWGLSMLLLAVGGVVFWLQRQGIAPAEESEGRLSECALPPERFQGDVVLVVGDCAAWFSAGQSFRETRYGWYIRVENPERLPEIAVVLASARPALLNRVTVMLALLPEHHVSDESIGHWLRTWQRALVKSRTALRDLPPVLVAIAVSAPSRTAVEDVPRPPWFTVTSEFAGPRIHLPAAGAVPVSDWIQDCSSATQLSRIAQMYWLEAVLGWFRPLGEILRQNPGERLAVTPVALGVCLAPVAAKESNLWQQHITTLSALKPPGGVQAEMLPLPDVLLGALPRRQGISPLMQFLGKGGLMAGVFLLVAMLISFFSNHHLHLRVSDHLALLQKVDAASPVSRERALQRLRDDSRLLDNWLQQGEPMRYGLGLYQGTRLIVPVEAALAERIAPQRPVSVPNGLPEHIRLDSLSLFKSGQAVLSAGASRALSGALSDINVRPGWLIVVAGHTDSTGSPAQNRALSLKRAEAVRDWMRDNSDIPDGCFAVQGHGADQPVATNTTPEGRAKNRRVEIRLVPQADACRVPDITSAPSQDDGALNTLMEK